ncbi:MAG: acyl-CoA thioesterase [Dysgonamonadaceae bacterium]|jgi:acyl-CoA thioester hydrolase|nr:acyl-CoA thioesterase [Dysgonamonadaceae bacterium]
MKKVFEIEMKVRDYECDVQGIVNNANYLHYFENTRHEFMQSLGTSFKESHAAGVDPVVSRADLHYKTPLTGSDRFLSSLTVERSGVKIIFHQTIRRKSDGVLCCKGQIEAVVLVNGQLSRGDYFDALMKDYINESF